jgi:hypothetical protein
MSLTDTVVPEARALDEDEFHAEFMVLLAAMNKRHTPAKVAQALGYTTKRQLANLSSGSLPGLRNFYNLLALDASAHDPLDRAYGHRKVPTGAICSSDPVSSKMATLLSRAIEAESPNSHGGVAVTRHEILNMAATPTDEGMMRDVARTLCLWVTELDEAQKPRLRGVA